MLGILLLKTLIIVNSPSDWETYSDDSGIFLVLNLCCVCAQCPATSLTASSVNILNHQISQPGETWTELALKVETLDTIPIKVYHPQFYYPTKNQNINILPLNCTNAHADLLAGGGALLSLNNNHWHSRKTGIGGCIFPDYIQAHSGLETTWCKIHFSFHVMVYLNPD